MYQGAKMVILFEQIKDINSLASFPVKLNIIRQYHIF